MVVLPAPEGPTSAVSSPGRAVNETSVSTSERVSGVNWPPSSTTCCWANRDQTTELKSILVQSFGTKAPFSMT